MDDSTTAAEICGIFLYLPPAYQDPKGKQKRHLPEFQESVRLTLTSLTEFGAYTNF